MKIKCRILSIIGVLILAGASAYFLKVAWDKSTSYTEVIATDMMFDTGARAFDMYINNKLVLSEDCVRLKPEDCTQSPEFFVAKYSSRDETTEVRQNYKFEDTGKYLVTGLVQVSPTYSLKDYLLVTVVDSPTEHTPVYIQPLARKIYCGERTKISELLRIKCPSGQIQISGTSGIAVDGDYVISNHSGAQSLFVQAEHLKIKVFYQLDLTVIDKLPAKLELNYGGSRVEELTFRHTDDTEMFTYQIVNAKLQTIICTTDSDVIRVISFDSPAILIKTLKAGECKLKITLVDDPSVVFEVKITVID